MLLALSFLVASIHAIHSQNRLALLATDQLRASSWSVTQLELDIQRLRHSLAQYRAGALAEDDLRLNFDLAWNRLEVIRVGEENRLFRERVGVLPLVGELTGLLEQHEALFDGNDLAPDLLQLAWFEHQLQVPSQRLHQLLITTFMGSEAAQEVDDLKAAQKRMLGLLGGLLLLGILLIVLLLHESRQLGFLSHHDTLTRLPNRTTFLSVLEHRCRLVSPDNPFALCLFDLRYFKEINNSLGHASGDALLMAISDCLRPHLGAADLLARTGGDEFALLLAGSEEREQLLLRAGRLHLLLQRVFALRDDHRVHSRMGIAVYSCHSRDADELFLFANLALCEARNQTSDQPQLFDIGMHISYLRQRQMAKDLNLQLLNLETPVSQLYLSYQPIITLDEQERLGLEVLLRWRHPELGLVPPLELVAVAESHGFGVRLGDWIMNRMSRDLAQLPPQWVARLDVSVNLSSSLFRPELAHWTLQHLAGGPLSPQQLTWELTETIALSDMELSRQILRDVRQHGIRMALDDFGTGWSSLSYLRELEVDKLKLDKSFIMQLDCDSHQQDFVLSITELAHRLGLLVVAEGVETGRELALVSEMGVDQVQGYHFARPLGLDELSEYVRQRFEAPMDGQEPSCSQRSGGQAATARPQLVSV